MLVLTTPNNSSLRSLAAVLNRQMDSGFTVSTIETGAYGEPDSARLAWVRAALNTLGLPNTLRGDCIFAAGRRQLETGNRFPAWLYSD